MEPITLTIGSAPDGGERLPGFRYAWLMYVWRFKPHYHCQRSLLGELDAAFLAAAHPGLGVAGRSFELQLPARARHIYLCADATVPDSGLHWVLEPAAGEVAETTTYNGVAITAINAHALDIPLTPDGYLGLSRAYTRCMNWRFGVAYYGVGGMDPTRLPEAERQRYRPA